ncbi:MAG: hypothetical protein AMJ45_07210 [Syntrophobacter sp. DG_60]|nr:MAG: hypothetical protein AMJ45_07210 [Syntrophobacter sp. DG_60]
MPVKKYKSFEEAERDQWVFFPDEAYFKRAFGLLRTSLLKRIVKNFPKGVFKYKTIEDAQKDIFNSMIKKETDPGFR